MILGFLAETYYRFKVPLFEWKEQRWVEKHFYHDAAFKALDQELLAGPSPYPLTHVFPYGETTVRTLYAMAQAVDLKPTDHFVDLGCGRGRAVFFLSHFFGCHATGIDLTPSFIKKAHRLSQQKNVTFLCQDFLAYDLKQATCIYLYGSTYSDEVLEQLEKRLPQGSCVITVSAPLPSIPYTASFDADFAWGNGTLFLHTVP